MVARSPMMPWSAIGRDGSCCRQIVSVAGNAEVSLRFRSIPARLCCQGAIGITGQPARRAVRRIWNVDPGAMLIEKSRRRMPQARLGRGLRPSGHWTAPAQGIARPFSGEVAAGPPQDRHLGPLGVRSAVNRDRITAGRTQKYHSAVSIQVVTGSRCPIMCQII